MPDFKVKTVFSKIKGLDEYYLKLFWLVSKGETANLEATRRLDVFDFFTLVDLYEQEQASKKKSLPKG